MNTDFIILNVGWGRQRYKMGKDQNTRIKLLPKHRLCMGGGKFMSVFRFLHIIHE